jgi:hypothetical protein
MTSATLESYKDIIIAPHAPDVARNAANDLQYHMEKITGRNLPLIDSAPIPEGGLHFFVGSGLFPEHDAAVAELPREGWMIRSVPDGLLLAGDEQGRTSMTYCHAVPLFLEKYCGVRWVWPGVSGEVIPFNPQLVIPAIDESGAPQLQRRRLNSYYSRFWDQKTRDEFNVWMARAHLGDQLRADFDHAWAAVMPESLYFKDHPEWFGQVDGKRISLQLCPSNVEMRDEFLQRLLNLPGNQELDVVSVSPNDGYGFCECDLCKAKGTDDEDYKTEAYWDFVSDIAQRVQVLRPGLGIGTFVYTFYRNPPKKIERLPENVYLCINTYATRLMRPEGKAQFHHDTDPWKPKGAKITIYEYWGVHYWMDLPILCPQEISTTLKLSCEAGMIAAEGESGKNFATMAPNYYVVTKTLWDPAANPKQILDEFYSTFGLAAQPVRAYYELLENVVKQAWNKYQLIGGYCELVTHYGAIFSPDTMREAAKHLDEAALAAGNDERLKERIDFVRIGYEYTSLMGELLATYDRLGRTGFPLESFEWSATAQSTRLLLKTVHHTDGREVFEKRNKEPFTYSMAEKDEWLVRAWKLGEKRLELLNRNRLNFAVDEGLYALTLEFRKRLWHKTVGSYIGKTESDMTGLIYSVPVS